MEDTPQLPMAQKKMPYQIQRERLYKYLLKRQNARISVYDIERDVRIQRTSARIWELRHLHGLTIENKTTRVTNGYGERVKNGFYRLITDKPYEESNESEK